MSGQSAFEKRYIDPKDQSDVEGLLEHFNLPPRVIAFLRENKRAIQIFLGVALVAVVFFSLYDSYRENRIEEAASALTLAQEETALEKKGALERVAEEYSGTFSGFWAKIELGHLAVREKDYPQAIALYSEVNKEVGEDNPMYGLTLAGIAQAHEASGDGEAAVAAYTQLQSIAGFQLMGYTGVGRVYESQGDNDKALGIYGQYLTVIGDDIEQSGNKQYVEAKIARLKAKK